MSDSARPYADGTYGTTGPGTSTDLAVERAATFSRQQAMVMSLARRAGVDGITGHDVKQATGWGDSPKSRALSNLLRDGHLARLVDRRDNGYIHVLPEHVGDRETLPYKALSDRHYERGYDDGLSEGYRDALVAAFEAVDTSDTLGAALIRLRRMIEEAG